MVLKRMNGEISQHFDQYSLIVFRRKRVFKNVWFVHKQKDMLVLFYSWACGVIQGIHCLSRILFEKTLTFKAFFYFWLAFLSLCMLNIVQFFPQLMLLAWICWHCYIFVRYLEILGYGISLVLSMYQCYYVHSEQGN